MKKGERVELKMEKTLCKEASKDDRIYICEVLKYDENAECIYLLLKNNELTELSLDAIYHCAIESEEGTVSCVGRIVQRYGGEEGKTLEFRIKNGFYKINIKLVDKQMT